MNKELMLEMEKHHRPKLAKMLLEGEEIVACTDAIYGQAFGVVGLTDKRVIFWGKSFKEETLSIGLSKISQVRTKKGGFLSSGKLVIEYSGGEVELTVNGNDSLKYIADAVTLAVL